MLVNCPKCGFSQPKDRYCASCGVDMDNFKRAPEPLVKALVTSPAFLIGVTFAVVIASVAYIRVKQGEEITSRARMLRSGPVIVSQPTAPPATPPTMAEAASQTAPDAEVRAADIAPAATSAPTEAPAAAPANKMIASEDTKTPAGGSAPVVEKHLTVTATYAEVDKRALETLKEISQQSGQFTDFGDFKSGAIPDLAQHLGAATGIKILQKVVKNYDAKSLQQQWFSGSHGGAEDEVGLQTMVVLEPLTDTKVHGEIELLRALHEQGVDGIIKKSYPISGFDLPQKWGWMVILELPRTPQTAEDDFNPDGLLRLFKSDRFQKKETEFTLFLDFDTRSQ